MTERNGEPMTTANPQTLPPSLAAALLKWRAAKRELIEADNAQTSAMLVFIRPPEGVTQAAASKSYKLAQTAYKTQRQHADSVIAELFKLFEHTFENLPDAELERIAKGQSK